MEKKLHKEKIIWEKSYMKKDLYGKAITLK